MIVEKEIQLKAVKIDYECDSCHQSNYKREFKQTWFSGSYYQYTCNNCNKVGKSDERLPRCVLNEVKD